MPRYCENCGMEFYTEGYKDESLLFCNLTCADEFMINLNELNEEPWHDNFLVEADEYSEDTSSDILKYPQIDEDY